MAKNAEFDLTGFLPYLLNHAAEKASLGFQRHYKERYGMLRTEWRVLFHLGRYGAMTAKEICERSQIHKTKVSRAVAKLVLRRLVNAREVESDRRQAQLSITDAGSRVFLDLCEAARAYDARLVAQFSEDEEAVLRRCLAVLAGMT